MLKLHFNRLLFACLFFIIQVPASHLFAQPWNLVRDQDGIKIYTFKEAGKSLKSFKGITDIPAPAQKVFAVIENVNDNAWWGANISQVKVMIYEKNKRSEYYLEYRLPWPLSNRDLVVEVKVNTDTVNQIYRTLANHLPGVVPLYPGKVRIPNYHQSWTVTPSAPGMSHVILEGYADPSGNIPDWITNLAMVDTPDNLLRELRKRMANQ
jgi:hypothetical protein